MKARLFASLRPFALSNVEAALSKDFECQEIPRGKTRKVLIVKSQGVLVMEAVVFDDIGNRDTTGDVSRRKEAFPDAFGNALKDGSLKFMLCTVNDANTAAVEKAIGLVSSGGIVEFEVAEKVQVL